MPRIAESLVLSFAALLALCVVRPPLAVDAQGIDGHIRYYSSGQPVGGVTVQLLGPTPATTHTDGTGHFSFSGLSQSYWEIVPQKFEDAQLGITGLDASVVLQDRVGLITLAPDQRLACDVSGNGMLSAFDAALILQFKVGLISQLPVAPACKSDWIFVPVATPTPNQQMLIQPQVAPTPCQPGAIVYQPLTSQVNNQDFDAILFGDCTGNWPGQQTPTPSVTATVTVTPTVTPTISWPTITPGLTISGLSQPVHITNAHDGSGRLFVVLQSGHIRVIKNNVVQPTDFLDIHTKVSCCGERGLLSVAFPPGYASKRYFYVNYTDTPAGDTVVARYRLTANDDIADPNSEQLIINITQPFANHNGGQLAFGPDGDLYIGMGDGGSGGDPGNRAQNTTELLGKILRIDVEKPTPTGTPTPYAIPSSNPVIPTPGARREIWAWGVRNPWRFSFDRLTGDLYIADVGQDSFEEIDFQPASSLGGENYGWRIMEGLHCFNPNPCSSTGLTQPVFEYSHASGNCSITGGLVYRGTTYPCMYGTYFYGDYCTGRIWGLRRAGATWQSMLLYDAPYSVSTFGDDETGNLWVADYSNGAIQMLTDGCMSATLTPTPTVTPTPTPTSTP